MIQYVECPLDERTRVDPTRPRGIDTFYIEEVEREDGVKSKLRDFRPTFIQMCLDRDPTLLSDVSKQLGHSTTRTTEKHYGRIRDRAAFLRLKRVFKMSEISSYTKYISQNYLNR